MSGRKWTAEEEEILKAEYNRIPLHELSQKLGRTECAITARVCGMRIGMPIIEFDCARCGKHVVTEGCHANGRPDMRKRFCCAACAEKYWRRPRNRGSFSSLQRYQSWEKFTNG